MVDMFSDGRSGRSLTRSRSLPITGDDDYVVDTSAWTAYDAASMTSQETHRNRELSSGKRRFFRFPSSATSLFCILLLFVALTPCFLWLRGIRDPMPVASVISLMACVYMFVWTASRSVSMGAAEVFVRVSYPVLLACVASYALRPFMGMVVLYLNTFHVAGLLGYTIAERQRWGWDDTCNFQFRFNPRRTTEKKADELRQLDDDTSSSQGNDHGRAAATPHRHQITARFAGIVFCSIISAACGAWALGVSCTYAPSRAGAAFRKLSEPVVVSLFSWTCFVHISLHNLVASGELLAVLFFAVWMSSFMLGLIFTDVLGDPRFAFIGGWLFTAWLAGFLGYSIAIYDGFKKGPLPGMISPVVTEHVWEPKESNEQRLESGLVEADRT